MRTRRILLGALAAAIVAVSAAVVPVSANAGLTGPLGSPPTARVAALHARFARLAGQLNAGPRAGIVPPLHARTSSGTTGGPERSVQAAVRASCTEPDCPLPWHGGAVQRSPKVYVVFWGPNWQASSGAQASEKYLLSFYEGLGTSEDHWSTVTSLYGDGAGAPGFSGSVYVNSMVDMSPPPAEVTPDDLAAEATAAASYFNITDLADAQVVVASQAGTCFSDGFAGSSCQPVQAQYCAWHAAAPYDSGELSFTNLPYQLDAGSNCGEDFVNPGGTWDGFSIVAGHEYAESITDPVPDLGWIDTADNVSGGEIADKCAWGGSLWGANDPAGDIKLPTGTFAVQSLWSNAAGRCVMSPAAGPPRVTLTRPATQASVLGHRAGLQIKAAANPVSTRLTYSASGLPRGLSINRSTGKIQGTVRGSVMAYKPEVTVRYAGGAESVRFGWLVAAVGAVRGYAAKCVDDFHGRTAHGNKMDIWPCNGSNPQRFTYTPRGQLKVAGGCLNAGKIDVFYEPCDGGSSQAWIRTAAGEYVVKSSRKCLSDPRNSRANGTQLNVLACKSAGNQHWSLP